MGLHAGRRAKQRIPDDPRNLGWAEDASRFAEIHLRKLGWEPSRGLGVRGEGPMSHVQVSHKLDMLGIGATQQKDGITWRQNQDFEMVLKRLNESIEAINGGNECRRSCAQCEGEGEGGKDDIEGLESLKVRTKQKRQEGQEWSEQKQPSRKEKGAGLDSTHEGSSRETLNSNVPAFRLRAHRARVITSKYMVSKSPAAISEILGMAPSVHAMSPQPTLTDTRLGTFTPVIDNVPSEKLTISAKSVADYFKEKLSSKPSSRSGTITPNTCSSCLLDELSHREPYSTYDVPPNGLGAFRLQQRLKDDIDLSLESHNLNAANSPPLCDTETPPPLAWKPVAVTAQIPPDIIVETNDTKRSRDVGKMKYRKPKRLIPRPVNDPPKHPPKKRERFEDDMAGEGGKSKKRRMKRKAKTGN